MNGNNDVVNVHNDVVTMDDNAVATMLESMRKGSKWLTAFLESYRPPLDGERYLTDREVAELLRVSPAAPCRSIATTACCLTSFWAARCCTRNRACVRCWRRTTASRSGDR